MIRARTIETREFEPITITWFIGASGPKVSRVCLSSPGMTGNEITCPEIEELADKLLACLNGEDIIVPLDLADLDRCPGFQRSVLLLERRVPRGHVTTYGAIAKELGTGARAVGNALARNPFPLMVPCHRAVAADRTIGGFQGGSRMKRALLEREGIEFDKTGRIAQTVGVWGFQPMKGAE